MEELSDLQSQDTNSDMLSSKGVEDEPRREDLTPHTSKAPLALTNATSESHCHQNQIVLSFHPTVQLLADIETMYYVLPGHGDSLHGHAALRSC